MSWYLTIVMCAESKDPEELSVTMLPSGVLPVPCPCKRLGLTVPCEKWKRLAAKVHERSRKNSSSKPAACGNGTLVRIPCCCIARDACSRSFDSAPMILAGYEISQALRSGWHRRWVVGSDGYEISSGDILV